MPELRYPKEGDYLWLRTDGSKKKLSRILIDSKIPADERKIYWFSQTGHILCGYLNFRDAVHIIILTIRLKRCFVQAYIRERWKQ